MVACVVGDGEAETGPLAATWHSNKFLNPVTDGAVLPILHLNGYKIANPTVLARIPQEELEALFSATATGRSSSRATSPANVHQQMAAALDEAFDEIAAIQQAARRGRRDRAAPLWPMIVLRTPKGWTGPKEVDGKKVEGSWRAHQVPLAETRTNPEHLELLEQWMRSYRPEELFDDNGALRPELRALAPKGERRMGANPHANGGLLLRDLDLPDFRDYAVDVRHARRRDTAEATSVLGTFLRDVIAPQSGPNFRSWVRMRPPQTGSTRCSKSPTRPGWPNIEPDDEHLAPTAG